MNEKIQSYKDLIVWQKAMTAAKDVYTLTASLPKAELYGLTSQIRRAAVSIPSNIAEGHKRGTRKDYRQFLRIALGSSAELETQLELTRAIYPSLLLTNYEEIINLNEEIQKILTTIISKLGDE